MSTNDVSRRRFMQAAGGATLAAGSTAAAGQPVAASGGGGGEESDGGGGGGGGGKEIPVFGGYLNNANNHDENTVKDARGQDEVTIAVGAGDGLAFGPSTVWVSPGTTITWEWTGEGGAHNVTNAEGPAGFESGDPVGDAGHTYEYEVTEEDAGITLYKCIPHEAQGMKGGVAVGDDVETKQIESGSEGPAIEIPDQALALTVATLIAMVSTLGLGYFLMKFGGDYEQ